MSDRERRPPGTDHEPELRAVTPIERGRAHRAGGGPTTKAIPPRPARDLPPPSGDAVQRRAGDLSQRDIALPWMSHRQADPFTLVAGLDWDRDVIGRAPSAEPPLLQARAAHDLDASAVQTHAAAGVAGPGQALPHQATIQAAFGDHDVSTIRAHVGGAAADASAAIGAEAYATGDAVAFRGPPDLHLAAHEAAHVVQQRAGVHLKGGVGQVGDAYEQHADAVADRVVAGQSAADLLDQMSPSGSAAQAVQRKGSTTGEVAAIGQALVAESPAVARLNAAHAAIEVTKARIPAIIAQAEAATTTSAVARANLMTVARAMYEPLQSFTEAAGDTGDPAVTAALTRLTPDVRDALNEIVRAALVIERGEGFQAGALRVFGAGGAGVSASNSAELRSVLATIGVLGRALGWQAPATLDAADTARYAHEPCPIGAEPVHPEVCAYSDAKREELRGTLVNDGQDLLALFARACDAEKVALEPLLKANAEARKATLGIFASLVKLGVSVSAPTLSKVVGFVLDQGVRTAADALARVALDKAPAADTASTLEHLVAALADQVRNLDQIAQGATDEELTRLVDGLRSIDAGTVQARVREFVARYRAQIEPIGHFAANANQFGVNNEFGVSIAAHVTFGGQARPALVKHLGVGPTPDRHGHVAGERYVFVRWLDADLAPMAGPLEELTASQVDGVPLTEVFMPDTGRDP